MNLPQETVTSIIYRGCVAYILWQSFDQATVSHGLNAQQVNDFPHRHVLFGHVTDPRDVTLTWNNTLR